VATWELIYFQLAPGFMANYQAYAVEQARAAGATPAEIQRKVVEMQEFAKLYQNPAVNAAMTFLEPLPVGLVMSLVSAGILSRRRRSSESALAAAVA
jgi:hypothetical protein